MTDGHGQEVDGEDQEQLNDFDELEQMEKESRKAKSTITMVQAGSVQQKAKAEVDKSVDIKADADSFDKELGKYTDG